MTTARDGAAPARTASTPPPRALGDYTPLITLARGGMATVYVARKGGIAGFERLVAIKCCHPHLCDDDEFVSMFLDEARLAARIHHPNVVATLDVDCQDDLYLVMEYVEGDSLAALLRLAKGHGALVPAEVTVRVMIDTLNGLHAAHELRGGDGEFLNLVHRDVSPQNILVGVDGIARITDFGIAFAAARSTVTQEGRLKGKFSYMAPEQVRGQAATRRIDVFAAGCVLWEALTGKPLFRRAEDAATLHAVLEHKVLPPSSFAPAVPRALDDVVLKALERDPDARFPTAEAFADALDRLRVDRAAPHAVALYVQGALEAVVRERRELIRKVSEAGAPAPERSRASIVPVATGSRRVRPETPAEAMTGPSQDIDIDEVATVETKAPELDVAATGVSPDPIEHWRMRSLLAAAMLLLVGSAVGIMLSRCSSGDAGAARAPASSVEAPAARPSAF